MKIDAKILLLLFGTLMLVSSVYSQGAVSQMSLEDKRRIVKSMLDSQKDIRRALLKIKRQIMGDSEGPGDHRPGDEDDDDDDDTSDDGLDAEGYDIAGGEDEDYFKEQQRKIREAREQLEACVKKVASSFIAMHDIIQKINNKIDEVIREGHSEVNYNLYYSPGKPHHLSNNRPVKPNPSAGQPSGDGLGYYKKNNRPYRHTKRGSRSLDETIPTIESKHFNIPDEVSVTTNDESLTKAVPIEPNQQQIIQ